MPLLTLSLSNCGINDSGFDALIQKLKQIEQKTQMNDMFFGLANGTKPKECKDYYRGGMGIQFSKNYLSLQSFLALG